MTVGHSSGAVRLGSESGNSLREACDALAAKDSEFRELYDPERMAYWGCKLFDNEKDARKAFG